MQELARYHCIGNPYTILYPTILSIHIAEDLTIGFQIQHHSSDTQNFMFSWFVVWQLDFAIQSRFLLLLILLNSENLLNDTNKLSDNQISVARKWFGTEKKSWVILFLKGQNICCRDHPSNKGFQDRSAWNTTLCMYISQHNFVRIPTPPLINITVFPYSSRKFYN